MIALWASIEIDEIEFAFAAGRVLKQNRSGLTLLTSHQDMPPSKLLRGEPDHGVLGLFSTGGFFRGLDLYHHAPLRRKAQLDSFRP